MSLSFDTFRDLSGNAAYGPRFSIDMAGVNLAANTAQSFIIPGYASLGAAAAPGDKRFWECIFAIQPGANVFIAYTPPLGNGQPNPTPIVAVVFSGTIGTITSSYNPRARFVDGGGTLSIISPDTGAFVGIELWTMPFMSQ